MCRDNVETIKLYPNKPADTIFTDVNTLVDLAEIANSSILRTTHLSSLPYFQNSGKYKSDLILWNKRSIL